MSASGHKRTPMNASYQPKAKACEQRRATPTKRIYFACVRFGINEAVEVITELALARALLDI